MSATEGIGRRNSIVEAVNSCRNRKLPMTRPAAMPSTIARMRPIAQPRRVRPRFVQKAGSPSSSTKVRKIVLAGGR